MTPQTHRPMSTKGLPSIGALAAWIMSRGRAVGSDSPAVPPRETVGANGGREASITQRARALIDQDVAAGRIETIESVAARLYVSRSHLCAVFKTDLDESIGSYMRRIRMKRAQRLLTDGELSIAEVSRVLGYPRQSALAQAFKHATGLSPRAWRAARETDR